MKPHEHIHHRIREMFHGKRNVFTILFMLLGGYLIIVPISQYLMNNVGLEKTMFIGLALFLFGYYYTDTLHKKKKK